MYRIKAFLILVLAVGALMAPPYRTAVADPYPPGVVIGLFIPEDDFGSDFLSDSAFIVFTGQEPFFGTLPGCQDGVLVFQNAIVVDKNFHWASHTTVALGTQLEPVSAGTVLNVTYGGTGCLSNGVVFQKWIGITR